MQFGKANIIISTSVCACSHDDMEQSRRDNSVGDRSSRALYLQSSSNEIATDCAAFHFAMRKFQTRAHHGVAYDCFPPFLVKVGPHGSDMPWIE